ncbi:tether containing UBX domain for GLUT4 [Eurytemora carolleeae]|uniref:tether containing UBX domain for GLUT4 n=1 Tax=Eurytemora carolleeae TaxID=1294199 RepID=UPI000C77D8B3|nr:tether containing UBX domain for GLUT4 [Eurytemora carolleeae]|eukprot:XP_023327268.1 tether containing UBX domain for GLUT4-like [Eurytemora affinis]
MSSVSVLCPNGHRIKVSTTPNMSILQVLETVCGKKGFDSARHRLEYYNKPLDNTNSIRFAGLSNNAELEMVELKEEEIKTNIESKVTVCLQVPSGERLIQEFPSTSSLEEVISTWTNQLGDKAEDEEGVVVYMRNEVVGPALSTTTLRSLGLASGKGLFRFFYKKPEVLKDQAKVYSMKVSEKPEIKPEVRHLPMRLEAARLPHVEDSGELEKSDEHPTEAEPVAGPSSVGSSSLVPGPSRNQPVSDTTSGSNIKEPVPIPDLTQDIKILYRDLKLAVKNSDERGMLLTKKMREAHEEGVKLAVLGRYKTGVLRVQFPDRLVVQGTFGPSSTIDDVMNWLRPLLSNPDTPFELYTAPPRTVLEAKSTILDLNLYPAALVYYSRIQEEKESREQAYIKEEFIQSLSNIQGANKAASQFRRGGERKQTGLKGNLKADVKPETIPESRPGKRSGGETPPCSSQGGTKLPKWFKTGK